MLHQHVPIDFILIMSSLAQQTMLLLTSYIYLMNAIVKYVRTARVLEILSHGYCASSLDHSAANPLRSLDCPQAARHDPQESHSSLADHCMGSYTALLLPPQHRSSCKLVDKSVQGSRPLQRLPFENYVARFCKKNNPPTQKYCFLQLLAALKVHHTFQNTTQQILHYITHRSVYI